MITTLTKSDSSKIIERWSSSLPYCTGYKIAADEVFNVARGTVIFIGVVANRYTITIQCNSGECLRYGNLTSSSLKLNQDVREGDIIGQCSKYVVFEYCTSWKGNSLWPVRIGNKTYYKQNPSDILNGSYEIESYLHPHYYGSDTYKTVKLTPEQLAEFGDNRGEPDNVEF